MSENNTQLVVVNDLKTDLKREAIALVKATAVDCAGALKCRVSEYAKYAVQRLFDQLINHIQAS